MPLRLGQIVVAMALALPTLAVAQSDVATVSGRITSQDGNPITGARVRAYRVNTGTASRATANTNGVYVVQRLAPGEYRLVVDKEGYRQIVLSGLVLSAQDSLSRNFTMEIGSVIQSVTLVAGVEEIDASPAVSTVVNERFVQNLPLNGRNFQSLLSLVPGLVIASYQYAPAQFSVNGQNPTSNYITADGVASYASTISILSSSHTVGRTVSALSISGGKGTTLPVDAMQEFRGQTSTMSAEFGRTPGGHLDIVTKSGTNEFHGSIAEYYRNQNFDARNYFDRPPLPKPTLQQNDFTITLGGPIQRNRTFFFLCYEKAKLELPATATGTFYTAEARNSVAPAYFPLLNALPVPTAQANADGLTAPLTVAYTDPSNLDSLNFRIDHTFRDRANMFVRYQYAPLTQSTRYWSENDHFTVNTNVVIFGFAYSFGSNKLNNFGANWSQATSNLSASMDNFQGAVPPPDSAMFPSGYDSRTSQFAMTFAPLVSGEVRSGPLVLNVQRIVNVIDTFSMSAGPHQLKFGFDYRWLNPTNGQPAYGLGVRTGGYNNLLNGVAATVITSGNATISTRTNNYSLFAMDTWRASARLTLTYGLRWDINTPPTSTTSGYPLYAVTGVFDSQPFGLASAGTPLYRTTLSNWQPRIGAAYRLTPEMLVRGGFGVFYDLGYGSGIAGLPTTFPSARSSFSTGPIPFDLNGSQFDAPPFTLVPNTTSSVLSAVDPNLRSPYVYEWNVAFERSLGANQSVWATYVGSYGNDLLRQDIVQLSPSGFPGVYATYNGAWSHYNALQVQYQRRMANGWQALLSYTLAKATDNASGTACPCSTSSNVANIDPTASQGPSDFDVRNSFAGGVSYNLPSVHWGKVGSALLSNWELDGIVRISSAPPYNPLALVVSPVFGPYYTRPNVVPGQSLYVVDPSQPNGRRLNSAAFAAPAPGQQGNLPRNYFRAFGINQTDLALSRRINLAERLSLYLRMDYFNVFNHPMFTPYNNIYLELPSFGDITQTLNQGLSGLNPLYQIGGPRSGQLTVKLQF